MPLLTEPYHSIVPVTYSDNHSLHTSTLLIPVRITVLGHTGHIIILRELQGDCISKSLHSLYSPNLSTPATTKMRKCRHQLCPHKKDSNSFLAMYKGDNLIHAPTLPSLYQSWPGLFLTNGLPEATIMAKAVCYGT